MANGPLRKNGYRHHFSAARKNGALEEHLRVLTEKVFDSKKKGRNTATGGYIQPRQLVGGG